MKKHPSVDPVAQARPKSPGTCGLRIVNRTNRTPAPVPVAGWIVFNRCRSAAVNVPVAATRQDGSSSAGSFADVDVSTRKPPAAALGPNPQPGAGSAAIVVA